MEIASMTPEHTEVAAAPSIWSCTSGRSNSGLPSRCCAEPNYEKGRSLQFLAHRMPGWTWRALDWVIPLTNTDFESALRYLEKRN